MSWKKGDLVEARAGGDTVFDFLQLNFEILTQDEVDGADLEKFSMVAKTDGEAVIRELRQLSTSNQMDGEDDFLLLMHGGSFYFVADHFELTDAFDYELIPVEVELLGQDEHEAQRWSRLAVVGVELEDSQIVGFLHCDLSDDEDEEESDHLRRVVVSIAQAEGFDADLVTMGRRIKPLFSIANVGGAV